MTPPDAARRRYRSGGAIRCQDRTKPVVRPAAGPLQRTVYGPGIRGARSRAALGPTGMLKRVLLDPIVGQAFRFGLVGVANTVLGLGTIYACLFLLGWPDTPANLAGYSLGLLQSFALNRAWTFRSRIRVLPGLLRFLTVFAVAYVVNLAVVLALRRVGVGPALAHAAGMPVYTLVFFLLSRWFVFPTARQEPGPAGERRPPRL